MAVVGSKDMIVLPIGYSMSLGLMNVNGSKGYGLSYSVPIRPCTQTGNNLLLGFHRDLLGLRFGLLRNGHGQHAFAAGCSHIRFIGSNRKRDGSENWPKNRSTRW